MRVVIHELVITGGDDDLAAHGGRVSLQDAGRLGIDDARNDVIVDMNDDITLIARGPSRVQ